MSLPDFKEKHILFIKGEDVNADRLRFNNENVTLERDGAIINQVSCHKLLCVFVVGDCSFTTQLVKNCRKYGVSLFLLTNSFELYAEVLATAEGNYLLREKQYRQSKERDLVLAKEIVTNKVTNQCNLLRAVKLLPVNYLEGVTVKVKASTNRQELLGIEGSMTRYFFQLYFKELNWIRRSPRSKVDIENTLLDIGYTMIFNFIEALLKLHGFDTYKGFYHTLFFQRKSLACDLVEPFRCIIDKALVKAHNLKQINKEDFTLEDGKYCLAYKNQYHYVKIFTQAIMDNKEEIFSYIRDSYYTILNDREELPFFEYK